MKIKNYDKSCSDLLIVKLFVIVAVFRRSWTGVCVGKLFPVMKDNAVSSS
jgi:hypothetical protein